MTNALANPSQYCASSPGVGLAGLLLWIPLRIYAHLLRLHGKLQMQQPSVGHPQNGTSTNPGNWRSIKNCEYCSLSSAAHVRKTLKPQPAHAAFLAEVFCQQTLLRCK